MSQDILGSVVRALVAVPSELLGMVKDFIHKITGNDSSLWVAQTKLFLQQKPCWPVCSILRIDRTKPFNPAEFIGQGWSIWRGPANGNGLEDEEEQNSFSLKLTEIDLNKIILVNTLKKGEDCITGEESINRLNANNRTSLDAKVLQTLWENRNRLPESFKQKTSGNITYIFCDGTILRSPSGGRFSLFFYCGGGAWSWYYYWLGDVRHFDHPSACLAS